MQTYQNIGGDSGVVAYEIGDGSIRVQFKKSPVYLYTNESAGAGNIQQMQKLAQDGDGLNSFINKYVRDRYEKKGA